MGIFNLFKKKLTPSAIQTGLIFKGPQGPDAIAGINPRLAGVNLNPSGSWKKYLPINEKQYIPFKFDTMSCTTFSILNSYETLLNFLIKENMLSDFHLKFLQNNGYFDNTGSVNFSDRFTAIMSNTTILGNDHITVMTCARNIGLLPDKDFPFGGNNFSEYHDKTLITQDMKDKALRFKNLFELVFQWGFVAYSKSFTPQTKEYCKEAIKQSPLLIAIKYPATHAIMMYEAGTTKIGVMDHYEPYTYKYKTSDGIHFGLQVGINMKPARQYPNYEFKVLSIPYGSSSVNVTALQQVLVADGFLDEKYITGNFFSKTEGAFIQWQKLYGLEPDGKCGKLSIAQLNKLCKKKI